jgi:hypothetical protein
MYLARCSKVVGGFFAAAVTLVFPAAVQAASVPKAPVASESADAEVSLQGPVHEAFLTPVQLDARTGMTVSQEPPEPIDEIPPDVKPKGDDVRWIPGYWAWENSDDDFIWVSGVWRNDPPTQRWVPGYWSEVSEGYRWTSGAWLPADQSRVSYQPAPPESLEQGPTSPQPSRDHYWVPGCWLRHGGEYRWRPGFWAQGRTGWVWVPDHYVLTGRGAIFVRGYWDHPLAGRGLLYAPLRIQASARPGMRLTPDVTVPADRLIFHLFWNDDYRHFCFGDYYDRGRTEGLVPWHEIAGARRLYDPLLSYRVWSAGREGVDFLDRLAGWNRYFLQQPAARPPRTLGELDRFLVDATDLAHAQQAVLGRTVQDLLNTPDLADNLTQLSGQQLSDLVSSTASLRGIATDRLDLESPVSAAGDTVGAVTDRVLNLPSLPSVEGVTRQVPKIPGLSPSQPSLPRNVPGLREGGSAVGNVTQPLRGATGAVEGVLDGLPLP